MSSFGYIVDYDIRPAAKPAFFFVAWPAALAKAALEFYARRSRTVCTARAIAQNPALLSLRSRRPGNKKLQCREGFGNATQPPRPGLLRLR